MCEGYVVISRCAFKEGRFEESEFSQREAWFWLISEASWTDKETFRDGKRIVIKRGEVVHSLRFMARRWKWSEARVRRFLAWLQRDAAIDARATREATHISICNYDRYQGQRRTPQTESDAPSDANLIQGREYIKPEEKKETRVRRASLPSNHHASNVKSDFPPDAFERFWALFPNKVGKLRAQQKLVAIGKRGDVSFTDLMSGLERYVRKTDDRPWCNPETFLNQGRWADEPATNNRSRDPMSAAFDRLDERIAEKQGRPTGQDGRRDPSPFDGPELDLTPEDGVSRTDWRLF